MLKLVDRLDYFLSWTNLVALAGRERSNRSFRKGIYSLMIQVHLYLNLKYFQKT